jgi:ABC-type methionine transport system ATPase subunit
LIPSMSAEENVALPMILAGSKGRASVQRRSRELLTRVGLQHRIDHLPSQLSGGEQQRVTIARAIANRPQLLLLDEPTGDLDTVNGTIILGLLLQLNRHEGITCVMVTHDQSLKHFAHRVVHMVDGKVLRIEVIDEGERGKADAELQRRVEDIQGDDRRKREERGEEEGGGERKEVTELRDTATYYQYIRQQEADAEERNRISAAAAAQQQQRRGPNPASARTGTEYAILPGVTAVVGGGTGEVHIRTSM